MYSKIKWLPDPTITSDRSRYKTFQEMYWTDSDNTDCPSTALETAIIFIFTAAKVRGVAPCLACDKLRCLFCEKQTTYKENNKAIVTLAVESNFYICGSPIFPESHPLFELVRVCTTSVKCNSPIKQSYYNN